MTNDYKREKKPSCGQCCAADRWPTVFPCMSMGFDANRRPVSVAANLPWQSLKWHFFHPFPSSPLKRRIYRSESDARHLGRTSLLNHSLPLLSVLHVLSSLILPLISFTSTPVQGLFLISKTCKPFSSPMQRASLVPKHGIARLL